MSYWYSTGTLSVANGATTVTGTLTGWNSTVRAGDFLFIGDNTAVEVGAVVDNITLTLARPWPFTTVTNGSYTIAQGLLWSDVTRLANEVANALANQSEILGGIGPPDNELGGDGSRYFQDDEPLYYIKNGATWGPPISIMGPQGPAGAQNITTSTTSRTIGTGTMSFQVAAGLALQTGMRMRATSGANYMEGPIASYSGTTLSITMDRFVGSGSFASWNIAPVGDKGDTGATGPGYSATSTSSVAIGTGSKAFSIGTGYAFAAGQRTRAARDTSNYVEGPVASYTGGTLTITADRAVGSGTYTSWTLGLAGDPGGQGIQGIQGNPGPPNVLGIGTITTGAPGSSADATITGTSPAQTLNLTIPSGANGTNGTNGTNGAPGSVLTATSTTSVTTATGDQTFTLTAVADFLVNQRVRAASNATPGNFMSGLVKSWNSGTKVLVVTVDLLGAAPATAADWNISVTGEKGDQGPAGGFGALLTTKGNWPLADGSTFGALSVGADGSLPLADSTATYGVSWTALSALLAGGYWSQSTIPSAATCDIGATTTPYVAISGSTAITSLGAGVNKFRIVEFTGSLVLTYNGTSLVLPGLANIITQAGDKGIFVSDASGNWKCVSWTPLRFLPKEVLTASRTYYVRTDGSDSNNGLTNAAGGAFLTIQRAVNVATTLDLNGFTLTIQVADGTYTGGVTLKNVLGFAGAGSLIIRGNNATPANVLISTTSVGCFTANGTNVIWDILDLKMQTATGGACLQAQSGGAIRYGNVNFGACANVHIGAFENGSVSCIGNYAISGGALTHFYGSYMGLVRATSRSITITNTPAFSLAFAFSDLSGLVAADAMTFSGSATGPRYYVATGGQVATGGGGTSYLPGNAAGTGTNFGTSPYGLYS